MRIRLLGAILLFIGALTSCSSSRKLEKPMAAYNETEATRRTIINIPVDLRIKALERTINEQLNGVIYNDDRFDDGDRMKLRIAKRDPIQLAMDGQSITFRVPLSLNVSYDAGITTLAATGEIALQARTSYQLKPNWGLETRTEIIDYQWYKKPVAQVGAFSLPVGLIADLVLKMSRNTLARTLDRLVSDNLKFGDVVKDTWNLMYQPILISEEYQAWLTINPTTMGMSPLKVSGDSLQTVLVMEAEPQLILGSRPPDATARPLPPFTQFLYPSTGFGINLVSLISYQEAERLARQQVVGETYTSGKRSVTVENLEIYGQGNQVIVGTKLRGSYNGQIYLSGTPVLNRQRNTIDIQNLDFTLDTRNFLVKSAGWVLKSTIKRKIADNLNFYLNLNLAESRQLLENQLNGFQLAPGLGLAGKVSQLELGNVKLTEKGFVVDVLLGGDLKITVDQLKKP